MKNRNLAKRLLNCARNRPHRMNFLMCLDLVIENKARSFYQNHMPFLMAKKLFLRFVGERKFFDFTEIDLDFLMRMSFWMKTSAGNNGRGVKNSTADTYMRIYQDVCNYAHKKFHIPYNYNFRLLKELSRPMKARHSYANDIVQPLDLDAMRRLAGHQDKLNALSHYINDKNAEILSIEHLLEQIAKLKM